jgi:hypothetical protein
MGRGLRRASDVGRGIGGDPFGPRVDLARAGRGGRWTPGAGSPASASGAPSRRSNGRGASRIASPTSVNRGSPTGRRGAHNHPFKGRGPSI